MQLIKGQKVDITKGTGIAKIKIVVAPQVNLMDTAIVVKDNGAEFIYAKQAQSLDGGLVYDLSTHSFQIDLLKVSSSTSKILIAVGSPDHQKMSALNGLTAKVLNTNDNQELFTYNVEMTFSQESAVSLLEVYRHNGEWKISATAIGFLGGIKEFRQINGLTDPLDLNISTVNSGPANSGNTVISNVKKESNTPITGNGPIGSNPPNGGGGQNVVGNKIELKKKGDKINLQKRENTSLGELIVNLNWTQKNPYQKGIMNSLFGSGSKSIDLDLGCFFEMKDGRKGIVQALGNSFGYYHDFPYVQLDGDDRSGSSTTGENLRINGGRIADFKRILVFTYIYEGAVNWSEAMGVVTIKNPQGPDIIVRMDEYGSNLMMCGIALLENQNNETFSIEKLVTFHKGHRELDTAYNLGLKWTAGSK